MTAQTTLTDLEKKVCEFIKGCDLFENSHYSCVEDIADNLQESTKTIRGVVSSLVKKNILEVGQMVKGCPKFVMLIPEYIQSPKLVLYKR